MRTPIRTTFAFQKEPFGRITVTPRRNCTRVIIKRRPDNSLAVSVPYGYDFHALDALLSEHSSQIANTLQPQEPQIRYHAGWTYSYPEGTAYINISSALKSRSLSIKAEGLSLHISAAPDVDFSNTATTTAISNLLKRGAAWVARQTVIPAAMEKARQLGISGISWDIATGDRTLGTCYASSRRIRLSRILVFLPPELREFVICHELAHLTHPDHSREFHALCNSYCRGLEKVLYSAIKNWNWPLFR